MSSWILPVVIAAAGLLLLLVLAVRLVVLLRRFRAVSAEVGARLGDRSGTLRTDVAAIRTAIEARRVPQANTAVTAPDGMATVRH